MDEEDARLGPRAHKSGPFDAPKDAHPQSLSCLTILLAHFLHRGASEPALSLPKGLDFETWVPAPAQATLIPDPNFLISSAGASDRGQQFIYKELHHENLPGK
jgi:hypothetical protein